MVASLDQPVVVDDHKGTLHAQMGSGPNSVYIVGTDGIVAHYAYWNDPAITQKKLQALLDAGGTTESLTLSSNPCRDPSKALENFDADMMHGPGYRQRWRSRRYARFHVFHVHG